MIPTNNYIEELSWGTHNLCECMIQVALIDNRSDFLRLLDSCQTEDEGQALAQKLLPLQPVMGYHSWPHGQGDDLGRAIRYQVDKDNFYERK